MNGADTGRALRRQGDLAGAATAFAVALEKLRGTGDDLALVDALCGWAETLTALGNPPAAATRAGEAVELLRSRSILGASAVATPQAARALLVLATAELHAGDPATGHIAAAVDMAERTVAALPTDANRALHATTLNNRSIQAQAAGQLADAVTAATEAVALRRELATSDRARFEKPLASSLNNLAAAQYQSGDVGAAAASVMEACGILRPPVDGGDAEAIPTLAAAESNAAACLGDVPDLDRAVRFGTQAVEDYERLTAALPRPHSFPSWRRRSSSSPRAWRGRAAAPPPPSYLTPRPRCSSRMPSSSRRPPACSSPPRYNTTFHSRDSAA